MLLTSLGPVQHQDMMRKFTRLVLQLCVVYTTLKTSVG